MHTVQIIVGAGKLFAFGGGQNATVGNCETRQIVAGPAKESQPFGSPDRSEQRNRLAICWMIKTKGCRFSNHFSVDIPSRIKYGLDRLPLDGRNGFVCCQ